MRERGDNVVDVISSKEKIEITIRQQIAYGSYSHQPIYGDGTAEKNIANILHELKNINVQKQLHINLTEKLSFLGIIPARAGSKGTFQKCCFISRKNH